MILYSNDTVQQKLKLLHSLAIISHNYSAFSTVAIVHNEILLIVKFIIKCVFGTRDFWSRLLQILS